MPAKKKAAKKDRGGGVRSNITAMRILFAFEYVVDQNGQKAAERAGYSKMSARATASKLLKMPEIQTIVKAGLKAKIKRCKVDADWVLKQSVRVYNRCMQVEPVFDKKGNQVMTELEDGSLAPAFVFKETGANKALENIGKHISVNAFKGTDDAGVPIDQNWKVTIVDGRDKPVDP